MSDIFTACYKYKNTAGATEKEKRIIDAVGQIFRDKTLRRNREENELMVSLLEGFWDVDISVAENLQSFADRSQRDF